MSIKFFGLVVLLLFVCHISAYDDRTVHPRVRGTTEAGLVRRGSGAQELLDYDDGNYF
jgi:hypothetical protein